MTDPGADAARYRLLATAVAERPMTVVPTSGPAYTDGSAIAVDVASPSELIRVQIVLHAALLASGSLAAPIMRRLITTHTATSRYLLIEAARLRDTRLADRLPVIARALQGPHVPLTEGPQSSLRLALSRQRLPSTPPEWGIIRPSRMWHAPPSPAEQAQLAPNARFNADEEEDSEDEHGSRGALERLLSSMSSQNSLLSKMFRDIFEKRSLSGKERAESGSAGEYRQSRGFRTGSVTTQLALPACTDAIPPGFIAARVVGWYPEWEVAKDRYLNQWCRVVELAPSAGTGAERQVPPDHRFRRQLARTGLSLQRRRREPTGQDLDLDSVIRHQIDLAAGIDPGERIWLDHTMSRRDLAVLVLLDASGSAAEGTGSTVLAQHIAVASAVVESLQRLGARVAAVSFEGRGRQLVKFTPLKHFNERSTSGFRGRVGDIQPDGFTRLGAAIRHGTAILRNEGGTESQLLVLLSDGFPYDDGYEGRHATHDTQRALAEARRGGIGCLCLSYAEKPPPAFEPATCATFKDLRDLEPRIGELFHRALATADIRRRYAPRVNA